MGLNFFHYRHCEDQSDSPRHCEERSDAAIFPFLLPFLLLFLTSIASAEVCKMTESAVPGLPMAACYMPMCNNKLNCDPPEVVGGSAKITYAQDPSDPSRAPSYTFLRPCPTESHLFGSCWKVTLPFHFEMEARAKNNAPNTEKLFVTAVGVNLAQQVNSDDVPRSWHKYLKPVAPARDGVFSMDDLITAYVPVGGRLDLAVYELCARDSEGNQGCYLPPNVKAFDYNLEHQ